MLQFLVAVKIRPEKKKPQTHSVAKMLLHLNTHTHIRDAFFNFNFYEVEKT